MSSLSQASRSEGVVDSWDIVYYPPPGMVLYEAARLVLEKSNQEHKVLSFLFNDVRLTVYPGSSVNEVLEKYSKECSHG